MILDFFEIEKYLDSKGIFYSYTGKNISSNWIGLSCPFCPDGDPSTHLGINLQSKAVNCWRCGTKGTVIKLIMKLENVSYEQALLTIKQFSRGITRSDIRFVLENDLAKSNRELKLDIASDKLSHLSRNYLISRRFDPTFMINKYKLKDGGITGDWAYRLIIPFYNNNKMITFIGRDTTGKQNVAYKNCPNTESIVDIKDTVYNLNNSRSDTVIVVEGTHDVWRIGDGCIALCGKQWTSKQIDIIRRYSRVFIMFDDDAIKKAEKLGDLLYPFVNEIQILEIDKGDPCDLTNDDVKSIRKDIFGRIY